MHEQIGKLFNMTIFKYTLLIFIMLATTSACTSTSLKVVQQNHFNTLYKNMSNELLKRNIVDSSTPWLNLDYFEEEKNYAKVIFHKLPAAIIFENNAAEIKHTSFSSSINAEDMVKINNNSFTISSPTRTITTNMIAIADWNSDGKEDWIISCFVKTKDSPQTRDYIIVALDPENTFKAYVVGVNECIGSICQQYQYYDDGNNIYGKYSPKTSAKAVDTLPGLRKVTSPPPTTPKAKSQGDIHEIELP